MLELLVEIDAKDLEKTVQILRKETDPLKVLDEAGAILLNRIRQRFLTETDPEGKKWKPSAAGRRRRAKGGTGTLFDTGRLYRSIQLSPIKNGSFNGGEMAQATVYTDVEYAKHHQFGTRRLPIRRFLGVNQKDMDIYGKYLAARLSAALNKGT